MGIKLQIILMSCFIFVLHSNALPDFNDGLVVYSYSETAAAFDLDSYVFESPFTVMPEGQYPYDATMTPDGSEVWVPGASGDGVLVIDRMSNSVSHRIGVGEYPVSVAFSADGDRALVSCRSGDGLWRIDTSNYLVSATVPITSSYLGPGHVAVDPVSGHFYVVDWYSDTLYEIDSEGSAVTRTAAFGNSFWQLVVSPDGTMIYIADRGNDSIWVVDRASMEPTNLIPVGDDPWGLDITADGSTLVVACEDSEEIWIVDIASSASTVLPVSADSEPRDVDILDEDGLAFVTGGWLDDGASPIYIVDIEGEYIIQTLDAPGTMANAIAVQAQMHGDGTDAVEALVNPLNLMAWPNPFNPMTEISFTLRQEGPVDLTIFDTNGRRLRSLHQGFVLGAGLHTIVWDGVDGNGNSLSSGVYLVNLATREGREYRKLVLLK
jgi:YVTN family beta-propeller protein